MKSELKQRWLYALGSGKYPKTKSNLKDSAGYCCLGVLADIEGKLEEHEGRGFVRGDYLFNDKYLSWLPPSFRHQVGLKDSDTKNLAKLNDSNNTFKEVMEYIENEV